MFDIRNGTKPDEMERNETEFYYYQLCLKFVSTTRLLTAGYANTVPYSIVSYGAFKIALSGCMIFLNATYSQLSTTHTYTRHLIIAINDSSID